MSSLNVIFTLTHHVKIQEHFSDNHSKEMRSHFETVTCYFVFRLKNNVNDKRRFDKIAEAIREDFVFKLCYLFYL